MQSSSARGVHIGRTHHRSSRALVGNDDPHRVTSFLQGEVQRASGVGYGVGGQLGDDDLPIWDEVRKIPRDQRRGGEVTGGRYRLRLTGE